MPTKVVWLRGQGRRAGRGGRGWFCPRCRPAGQGRTKSDMSGDVACLGARRPAVTAPRRLTLAELEDLAVRTRSYHWLPVIRAARQNRIWAGMLTPGGLLPARFLDPANNPGCAVLVIGGDLDPPAGPDRFPQAARALRWATHVMLHATGGQPFHYEAAVMAAEAVGARVVLVECASATLAAWEAFTARYAPKASVLRILPHPGEVHPVPGVRH